MSVLDRSALEASPLADLHTIASELGIDGFRRLRKEALIDAILVRQGDGGSDQGPSEPEAVDAAEAEAVDAAEASEPEAVDAAEAEDAEDAADAAEAEDAEDAADATESSEATESLDDAEEPEAAESSDAAEEPETAEDATAAEAAEAPEDSDDAEGSDDTEEAAPRRRRRRGGRRRRSSDDEASSPADDETGDDESAGDAEGTADDEDKIVEGTVELLGGGSGFVRISPPDPSDEDVYISAAQVRRCELVTGDVIAGPVRPPRRSERYPSLVRVDTINGTPADEVTAGTRYEDMPSAFPSERLALGGDDPTVHAIEWLTPFGKGSRVALTGPARSGKTQALQRVGAALAAHAGEGEGRLQVSLVLAGVRPEEVSDWEDGPAAPAAATALGTSPDSQAQAIERVLEQARRVAARGRDAVVLIDGLDGVHPPTARKALASARNLVGAGSLTIVATATEPVGGETTVIAFNRDLASTGRFPAVDLGASGTIRPELLVGEEGAEAIAKARREALEQ